MFHGNYYINPKELLGLEEQHLHMFDEKLYNYFMRLDVENSLSELNIHLLYHNKCQLHI